MSSLYPVAVGVIPNLLAIYVQQGLNWPLPYWGNFGASLATLIATIVGWILAVKVTVEHTAPSLNAEIVIYLALGLPGTGIVISLSDDMRKWLQVRRGKAQLQSNALTLWKIKEQLDRIEARLP